MRRSISISVSVILLTAFLVFNVGVPVYFYLCPMMSNDMPICDVSPARATTSVSFTTVTPDCCARIFVADRKTTPYLSAKIGFDSQDQLIAIIMGPDPVLLDKSVPAITGLDLSPESPPPLYLLHSTLLI